MRNWKGLLMAVITAFAAFVSAIPDAEARRLGGGKSFGRQSSSTMQRAPAAPSNASSAAQQRPGAGAAPARNRWLGPLAGLAAGLGLAALASHLGLGEQFGTVLLVGLLVMAALYLVRRMSASRAGTPALQGGMAGGGVMVPPHERHPMAAPGARAEYLREQARAGSVPDGFDSAGFLREAKVQFIRLQAVFDAADLKDLREFTSPEVYAELKLQIEEQQGVAQRTDVVRLEAELLALETLGSEYQASVRFAGLIREQAEAAPTEFAEIWTLCKPLDASSGWVLAGITQA